MNVNPKLDTFILFKLNEGYENVVKELLCLIKWRRLEI